MSFLASLLTFKPENLKENSTERNVRVTCFDSNRTNMSNFDSPEVVGRGSETTSGESKFKLFNLAF